MAKMVVEDGYNMKIARIWEQDLSLKTMILKWSVVGGVCKQVKYASGEWNMMVRPGEGKRTSIGKLHYELSVF